MRLYSFCLFFAMLVPTDYALEDLEIKRDIAVLELKKSEVDLEYCKEVYRIYRNCHGVVPDRCVKEAEYKVKKQELDVEIAKCKVRQADLEIRKHKGTK